MQTGYPRAQRASSQAAILGIFFVGIAACSGGSSGGGGSRSDGGLDSGVTGPSPCIGSRCAGPACMSNPSLCDETEFCDPRADASTGCVPGRACAKDSDCEDFDPCTQSLGCDHTTALCRYRILDSDGDNHWAIACGGDDCDDADFDTHPRASELCDGRDNDCDGEIDPPEKVANACGEARMCNAGACICKTGLTECSMRCVDPESFKTSNSNCGRCGNACTTGKMCDQGSCVDRDECADGSQRCPDHSKCMNITDGYNCVCDAGWQKWGNICEDTDECRANQDNCDSQPESCVDTDGSFECRCPKGYEGTGIGDAGCTDIDECLTDPCNAAHSRCFNTVGSFICGCVSGFTLSNDVCTNINECANMNNDCDHSPEACVDTEGSFTCECPSTHVRPTDGRGPFGCASRVKALASGGQGEFSCALLTSGRVQCWGTNDVAQLGTGDQVERGGQTAHLISTADTVRLGNGRSAKAIAVGSKHTCAILNDDSLRCWGQNVDGQLGIRSTTNFGKNPSELGDSLIAVKLGSGRTAKAVATGLRHTCAILDTGSVKCWGDAFIGQLGLDSNADRGGSGDAMGDTLPTVNLGAGRTAKMLTAGDNFNCAILDDDSVKCWGSNGGGELGQGDTNSRGYSAGQMAALAPVSLGSGLTAKTISAGGGHVCAILSDDTVKCWGSNFRGALGLETSDARGDGPNEMGDMLPTVFLGAGRTAKGIACGIAHTCAILDDGSVKCWGSNQSGQLGIGNTTNVGDAANSMHTLLPVNLGLNRTATAIRAAREFTCAILDDERVKCWGLGLHSQLGQGELQSRGDEPNEMGDALGYTRLGG